MHCLDLSCPCELTECYPSHSGEAAYHTEIIVDGKLHIPEAKPPCEKIINISHKICLTKVVPVPVKLDNGCVAGYKLLVVGTIRLGFEYSACVPEQNVHFVHFDIPFQGLITGNPCHQPIPLHDCNLRKFNLRVCVEHIEAQQVSPRSIEKVVVLLFWLQRKNCNRLNPCEPGFEAETPPPPHSHIQTGGCQPKPCSDGQNGYPGYTFMDFEPAANCPKPDNTTILCNPVCQVSKQISVNDTLIIRPQKPPAERILDSSVDIDICKAKVIKTPLTDHCQIPIMKVVVTGKAWITVKYVADVPNQQVHATAFNVPFEALIEWPGGPSEHTPVCVAVTVEHFQVDMLDCRKLFMVLILRLDVDKK